MLTVLTALIGVVAICTCFTPPEISFSNLQTTSSANYVHSTLSKVGILAIKDIPQLPTVRRQALLDIQQCLGSDNEYTNLEFPKKKSNGVKALLPDGTIRRTIVLKDDFEKLPYCPEIQSQLELLRHLVRMTANSVATSLDLNNISLHIETLNRNPLTSFSQVIRQAKRLDHFHLYRGNSTVHSVALDMHVDAGIFIAFVPPLWKDQNEQSNSGLLVQLPSGQVESMELNENTVVIMIGMGARKFLHLPFRPVPHFLQVPKGTLRSWYGHMVLLPDNVLVGEDKQTTFLDFWMNTHEEIGSGLGCSPKSKKLLGMDSELIDQADPPCPMGTMDCWSMHPGAICIEDISCPGSIQPICMADHSSMGPHTCTDEKDCRLQCNGTVPPVAWCSGGTAMYMDGFQFSTDAKLCNVLFFSFLTMNTQWKFFWGCVVSLIFGMLWPGVKTMIRWLNDNETKSLKYGKRTEVQPLLPSEMNTNQCAAFRKNIFKIQTLLLLLDQTCGYLLMFLAMTYSLELLFCTVLGITLGKVYFKRVDSEDSCC